MQRVPMKKKSTKTKLSEQEILAKERFYNQLEEFYLANNSEESQVDDELRNKSSPICEYEDGSFFLKSFESSQFETFGRVKDKILYLTQEETFYLKQIGKIKIEVNLEKLNIANLNLYSSLRRAGKIVECLNHDFLPNESKFSDYFIIYETTEDYRSNTPSLIIKVHTSNSFTGDLIKNTLSDCNKISQSFFPDSDFVDSCIAFIKGSTIHILKIKNNLI